MTTDTQNQLPIIFLAGPPGAGKSTLGKTACEALDLTFLDLSTPEINAQPVQAQTDLLKSAVNRRSAAIIALPWRIQQDKGMRIFLRRSGVLLLLWAHPLAMQERSGRPEPLFTPAPRIKTVGGFGRNGTGCREFRSLSRATSEVLMLVGSSFDDAAAALKHWIVSIREERSAPPIIRAGVTHWIDDWHKSYNISKPIVTVMVEAMARYIVYLQSEGKSDRVLSGVYSDLQAAGMLVIQYDYPKKNSAAKILALFASPPWTIEFERKFSSSPNLVARYERTLRGFAKFLKNHTRDEKR